MASAPASAQDYYDQFPIEEPEPHNDILPPADDFEGGAMDEVIQSSPQYVPRPPPEVLAPSDLRIASWDLSEAPSLMPVPQVASQAATWRTTFGSERRSEAEISSIPATQAMDVDADIVLLQGVSDVAALRRLFQPRNWRLVVSRRATPSSTPGPTYAGAPAQSTATPVRVTAIAVKAKRGLRIMGREHILELASAGDGKGSGTAPSATAVRVADGTRLLWLLSVELPDACSAGGTECPAQRRISDWQQSKLAAGQTSVIGGRYKRRAPGAATQSACAHQAIETDLSRSDTPPKAPPPPRHGMGCVALLELPAK